MYFLIKPAISLALSVAKPLLLVAAVVAAAHFAGIDVVSLANNLLMDYAADQISPF